LRVSGVGLTYPPVGPVGIAIASLWMGALTVYDIRQRRLPNWLTLPGFAVIILVAIGSGRGDGAALGAGALAAVYLLTHVTSPAAMGAGDVKLALGLGALTGCFGLEVWLLAAIGAPLLTAAIGALARLAWSMTTVPHGPSMCAVTATALGLVVF
jgi:leader peptidase (prepilin peptidase) / N-methyltransferase